MYLHTFTYEQITADLSSKTVLTARRGDKYINHDIPDEDVKYRQKFERSKTSGHNPWVQSQYTHTHFTNTVQYLVQACRPTGELTTEHELVRSVVPSTSVSWCVWHIDHARLWNLTRVSQVASQTVTLHAQDTSTVLRYHHTLKIYVHHTSSIIIQFWMDNDRMSRIHSMWWMTSAATMLTAKCAKR